MKPYVNRADALVVQGEPCALGYAGRGVSSSREGGTGDGVVGGGVCSN